MKLNQLKSNPNNPRLIKDDKFKKLVTSLSEFPEMMEKRPMVCVTDTDGKLYPLGGNMRLKALQELKYKEIPDAWVMLADEWSDEKRKEIARLYKLGMSTRQIGKELSIPSGSIHYILREFNLQYPSTEKPNRDYLTREEAKYLYDITDSQFDYARTKHPKYTVKFNNKVFLHRDYIFEYIEGAYVSSENYRIPMTMITGSIEFSPSCDELLSLDFKLFIIGNKIMYMYEDIY